MDFDYGYEDFPSSRRTWTTTSRRSTINQEFRLVSQGTERWNWIVGAYFNRYETRTPPVPNTHPGIPESYGLPPGTPDLEYLAVSNRTYEEMALFGELGYEITDRWQVTVGARWFDFEDDLEVADGVAVLCRPAGYDRALRQPQQDRR